MSYTMNSGYRPACGRYTIESCARPGILGMLGGRRVWGMAVAVLCAAPSITRERNMVKRASEPLVAGLRGVQYWSDLEHMSAK